MAASSGSSRCFGCEVLAISDLSLNRSDGYFDGYTFMCYVFFLAKGVCKLHLNNIASLFVLCLLFIV